MFGTLRLILAVLVVCTHLRVRIYGVDQGMAAAMLFFLLSGYVMTGLVRRYYPQVTDAFKFYIDRVMRLYPQLTVYLVLAAGFIFLTGYRGFFIRDSLTMTNFARNLAIVPIGYDNLNSPRLFELAPPVWSLGAEVQFYLLMPFMMFRSLRFFVAAASAIVFLLDVFMLRAHGVYGANTIPESIFIFLTGSLLYDSLRGNRSAKIFLSVLYSLIFACAALALIRQTKVVGGSVEVLIGYIVGVPLLIALSRIKRRKLDDLLGEYSYGVFLVHFPLLYFFEYLNRWKPEDHKMLFIAMCIATGALGFHCIESPVLKLRHAIRTRRSSKSGVHTGEKVPLAAAWQPDVRP